MANFSYQAINEKGANISGSIEAESVDMVNNILLARGHIPVQIQRQGTGRQGSFSYLAALRARFSKIQTPELILFTKQFRTMLRAGVPIIKLLGVLENQTENTNMRNIINTIARDIKEGAKIHEAFRKHPSIFSPLYCSMVQAGEISGGLPEVLDRLIYIIDHEHKIKSDIKAALQYPVIVIFFLLLAFIILLTFVIPKFVFIFERSGVALPAPTRFCLFLYQFLSDYWTLLALLLTGGGILLYFYLRTDPGKLARDNLFLRVPVLGSLFIKAAMSRFASIFSILMSSGVSVLESMRVLSGVIGNQAIAREYDLINERLEEGRGIAGPLAATRYFTPIVVNMVAIGEESGNLEEMLEEISAHYDSEVEYAMKKLSDLIGPVLTIGLAAVVGFFALSIFLPMWVLSKKVK